MTDTAHHPTRSPSLGPTHGPIGIRFTETMRGHMATDPGLDHEEAELRGRRLGRPLAFTVTVTFDELEAMLADPDHAGRIEGTVTAPSLSPEPLRVEGGVFHLFTRDPSHPATYLMRYRMPLAARDGRRFLIRGIKTIRDDTGFDMWRDTTTLAVDVEDAGGGFAGRGIVRIAMQDFARQLATMEATGTSDPTARLWALSCFGSFFQGVLREVYGDVLAPAETLPSDGGAPRRALRCGEGERMPVRTADGVELRLTRFNGGARGPVLLTPGFGTSTLAYTVDTVETNLPEFLFERGYDVWLLDYRASPDLPAASGQFSLDDIARHDYPAAVGAIRARTGAETIQVMAHCVGSLTFQMAQTLGLEGVRSAVCSQLTLHPHPPLLNRIKGGLYLAELVKGAGIDTLSTDFTGTWAD
ncbi:MAG TPA: hypothetical protein VK943_05515, partial [Arenibaculum sp.]|nr:hypothetical protein [Arenibaculum sp.]